MPPCISVCSGAETGEVQHQRLIAPGEDVVRRRDDLVGERLAAVGVSETSSRMPVVNTPWWSRRSRWTGSIRVSSVIGGTGLAPPVAQTAAASVIGRSRVGRGGIGPLRQGVDQGVAARSTRKRMPSASNDASGNPEVTSDLNEAEPLVQVDRRPIRAFEEVVGLVRALPVHSSRRVSSSAMPWRRQRSRTTTPGDTSPWSEVVRATRGPLPASRTRKARHLLADHRDQEEPSVPATSRSQCARASASGTLSRSRTIAATRRQSAATPGG